MLGGCVSHSQIAQTDREEMAYTVMDMEQLPAQLTELIEANRQKEIRMSYTSGEDLYLIRGYGEQQSSGCRIEVLECSQSEDDILLETQLIGPDKSGQETGDDSTCPVLVLRIDSSEKEIQIN
jgi:hypothetical protein